MGRQRTLVVSVVVLLAMLTPAVATAAPPHRAPTATLLVSGLEGGGGSTVGPGGALYVTEAEAGRISRVDPRTGEVTTFASGLPTRVLELGGAMDVAFLGGRAYALVTLVGADVGGDSVVGIYRIDGPDRVTVIADIGGFSVANPPTTDFFVPTGVQYALETYRGALLVTDGHHNRVLRVTRDGDISVLMTFGNIVPTGLATRGNTIYMAEAGPVPHLPENGRVVTFGPRSSTVVDVASGAPLLVDVELGRGHDVFALSQGRGVVGAQDGAPAEPGTGALVEVLGNGTFSTVVDGLDRPTSFELIRDSAYIVTLTGEIWRIDNVSTPPHGKRR